MTKASEKINQQMDMFPEKPKINGLAIADFKTSGAEIKASLVGVTNVVDIAKLDDQCWKMAIATWFLSLHVGDLDKAWLTLNDAYQEYIITYPTTIDDINTADVVRIK